MVGIKNAVNGILSTSWNWGQTKRQIPILWGISSRTNPYTVNKNEKKIGMKSNIEHVYVKLKNLEGSGWPARVTIIKEDFLEE